MKFKSAAFLGVKSLIVKPFRLVLTILISAIAFAVFALFDTVANFNTVNVLKNTLYTSSAQTVTTTASYIVDFEAGDEYDLQISDKLIADLERETKGAVKGIFDLSNNTDGRIVQSYTITEIQNTDVIIGKKYYSQTVNGFIEFDAEAELEEDGTFKDFPYQLISGRYPSISYQNDVPVIEDLYEVAISNHLADSLVYYLNGNKLNEKKIEQREDLIGAKLTVNEVMYTIVGLIDCGTIPEKYDALKSSTPHNVATSALLNDYTAFVNAGAQNCLFVATGFKDGWKELNKSAEVG